MGSPSRSPPPEAERDATPSSPVSKSDLPGPTLKELAIDDHPYQDNSLAVALSIVGTGDGEAPRSRGPEIRCSVPPRENGIGVFPEILRRRALMRAAFGLRVSAALLCLVSFSIMVADNTPGWAGDSFARYSEYRYLVSVNAMAFLYSAFQAYGKIHHLIFKKIIIHPPLSFYFDLAMDQVLAYLLLSASSIAASRNDVWVSRFGSDEFIQLADGSITIAFLAFVPLSLSALISAHNLFRWRSGGATL
ncbi:CASP-like protein 4A3 [Zingiber officinale]|uniref:CASP-like protein n=1 Tax=Zingiber officinale TaxID=94328 RepID=A0A8J5HRV1_ZINOF|nr:CASP-like protein 4A3 [Zingiber officinale]KAG6532343.1 hypothetical protein ZIOFF_006183 [Zingiber officinale]